MNKVDQTNEYVYIYSDDCMLFYSVSKKAIEKDAELLEFVFTKFFNINKSSLFFSSALLSMIFIFPKTGFASQHRDRQQQRPAQIQKMEPEVSEVYVETEVGTGTPTRPSTVKSSKGFSNSFGGQRLKFNPSKSKKESFLPEYTPDDFHLEKIHFPEVVRYKTMLGRSSSSFKDLGQSRYQSASVSVSQGSSSEIFNELRPLLKLSGGFRVLTLGVLISRLRSLFESENQKISQNSKQENVRCLREQKLCLLLAGLISFLTIALVIVYIKVSKMKIDNQILIQFQSKLVELYNVQQSLQEDLLEARKKFSEMENAMLDARTLAENFQNQNFEGLNSLIKQISEGNGGNMTPLNFKRLWVKQCSHAVFSLMLSEEFPELQALVKQFDSEKQFALFVKDMCEGK